MNKLIKTKWLEALRSGKYKQARRKLKSRNGAFCCLGVLCDIQGAKAFWNSDVYLLGDDGGREAALPPEKYSAQISDHYLEHLTKLNDGHDCHKHSFSEIADYIEKNL